LLRGWDSNPQPTD